MKGAALLCLALAGAPLVALAQEATTTATYGVPGWPDRDYDLSLPSSLRAPVPVLVVFHGGAGNKDNMRRLACPGGDLASPGCLDRVALAAGMAVVFPNGSNGPGGRLLGRGGIRTWNAGGGQGDAVCVSGDACKRGVDDVAYVRALLADVGRRIAVDPKRVYATGFSNGAALAHRLACEAADLFAAVAPVSGENQAALARCDPSRPVALLVIHGTEDRCWPYAGGNGACIATGRYVSVAETMAGWAVRNHCRGQPIRTTLPPRPGVADATSVVSHDYASCAPGGALRHLEVVGHGHFWPDGHAYARPALLGGTLSRQLDASRAIVAFLEAHARP
jgi:polyhydroxybutyrate depolymerase